MGHRFVAQATSCNRTVANHLFFDINSTPNWRHENLVHREAPIDNTALGIYHILSFHLLPHLLRLIAMAAMFFMCERR